MDIVSLIISLISGGVGGNVAGAAMKDKNLGPLINSVVGLLGGGAGSYIAQALELFGKVSAAGGMDMGQILGNIGTSGVSGAILVAVVSLIKNAMEKRT